MNKFILAIAITVLASCARHEDPPPYNPPPPQEGQNYDPSILVDTYEREIWLGCAGETVSDKIVRRPKITTFKINPHKNIPINSSAFVNLETGDEWVPRPVF